MAVWTFCCRRPWQSDDHFFVHGRGARGGQIVADDDALLGELSQVQPLFPSHEVIQDARGDIAHVEARSRRYSSSRALSVAAYLSAPA